MPLKYRQLIGVAIHAETKCKYCIPFHLALAKVFGATDAEIQEAVNYAKHTTGVSTYLNGLDFDLDEFLKELDALVTCLRRKIPRTNTAD
ncbi:MAG: carboxymuconolactone decarboxylase family protein [Cyanobacteria bacterium P01_D01_bin.44]